MKRNLLTNVTARNGFGQILGRANEEADRLAVDLKGGKLLA